MFDDLIVMNSQYFKTNNAMQFDFDNKMMYLTGSNIRDQIKPIPDPILPKKSGFPVWAIIALIVVGVLGIGVLVWYLKAKQSRDLSHGLAKYSSMDK